MQIEKGLFRFTKRERGESKETLNLNIKSKPSLVNLPQISIIPYSSVQTGPLPLNQWGTRTIGQERSGESRILPIE